MVGGRGPLGKWDVHSSPVGRPESRGDVRGGRGTAERVARCMWNEIRLIGGRQRWSENIDLAGLAFPSSGPVQSLSRN